VNKKTTTVVEKLTCYSHDIEIIKDRLALERHMQLNKASFDAILFARKSESSKSLQQPQAHTTRAHWNSQFGTDIREHNVIIEN